MKNSELTSFLKNVKTDRPTAIAELEKFQLQIKEQKKSHQEFQSKHPEFDISQIYSADHPLSVRAMTKHFETLVDSTTFKDKDLKTLSKLTTQGNAFYLSLSHSDRLELLKIMKDVEDVSFFYSENISRLKRVLKSLDHNQIVTGSQSQGFVIKDPKIDISHFKDTYVDSYTSHQKSTGFAMSIDIVHCFRAIETNWRLVRPVIKNGSFRELTDKEMILIFSKKNIIKQIQTHIKSLKNVPDQIKDHFILE